MPLPMIRAYLERIPQMQAEYRMMLAEPTLLPHMDKHARRRTIRRWERIANAKRRAKPASKGELAMIGVKKDYA